MRLILCIFILKQKGDFAAAAATFFRPASKEGKGAPVQRGSGSFGNKQSKTRLTLTTNGVRVRATARKTIAIPNSADPPSCHGRLLPPLDAIKTLSYRTTKSVRS